MDTLSSLELGIAKGKTEPARRFHIWLFSVEKLDNIK